MEIGMLTHPAAGPGHQMRKYNRVISLRCFFATRRKITGVAEVVSIQSGSADA